jgi:hypothetical protein
MTSAHPHYRAYCKDCGYTVRSEDSSTFMDPFFLPERCPGCHRYSPRHGYVREADRRYKVEFGFWKFVAADPQPPKRWWWPFGVVGEDVLDPMGRPPLRQGRPLMRTRWYHIAFGLGIIAGIVFGLGYYSGKGAGLW